MLQFIFTFIGIIVGLLAIVGVYTILKKYFASDVNNAVGKVNNVVTQAKAKSSDPKFAIIVILIGIAIVALLICL